MTPLFELILAVYILAGVLLLGIISRAVSRLLRRRRLEKTFTEMDSDSNSNELITVLESDSPTGLEDQIQQLVDSPVIEYYSIAGYAVYKKGQINYYSALIRYDKKVQNVQ